MSCTATTEEALLLPNEWLDYFYQQQIIMDDLDVPFGAISDAAVSDDTSFGDDVFINPGSDTNFSDEILTPGSDTASLKVSGGDHETMLVHNVTGTSSNNTTAAAAVFSPENSSAASNVDLSPKANIAKQVKRRSRASRRTPTTLLNASIKNFRTLVQQYTGFQSATSGFNRSGKGPITLSFGAPNERNDFPVSFGASFDGNYYYTHQPDDQFQMNQQQVDQIYGGKHSLC